MFETVAPAIFAKRSRAVFYETLPVSLAVHAVIAAALVTANVWTVTFPDQSPAQIMAFNVAEIPPPPPPPPPPPKAAEVDPELKPIPRLAEIVAPTFIPEEIPKVEPVSVVEAVEGEPEGVEGGLPGGQAGGAVGGILGGVIGGLLSAKEVPGVVKVPRDRPLPMHPLSQIYPSYPDKARFNAWEDQLVVRYIIGKDGRVKEVSVITPPEREIFTENTIKAIRAWRFRPLIKNGERQEVVHELTVLYRLVSS